MKLAIPYVVAKLGSRHPGAIRVYLVLLATQHNCFTTTDALLQTYAELGLSRASFYRDLRQLRALSQTYALVDFSAEKLRAKSGHQLHEALGMHNLGAFVIDSDELSSIHRFRQRLYPIVAFRDGAFGATTISRQGLTKLTGLSRSTQKRYEKRLKIDVQPNVAVVLRPDGMSSAAWHQELYRRYGPRFQSGTIRLRNTYFASGTRPVHHPRGSRGKLAAEVGALCPEYGERYQQQTFYGLPADLEACLERTAVDLFLGPDMDQARGFFLRLEPGQVYQPATIGAFYAQSQV